jgi:hypothetical protein
VLRPLSVTARQQPPLAILLDYGTVTHWEMSTVNLYSKEQKLLKGKTPDIYQHDDLPEPLRVQIVQIWDDTIGVESGPLSGGNFLFEQVRKHLCREYGVQELWRIPHHPLRMEFAREEITKFFLNCPEVEKCLDVIQLVFALAQQHVRLHERDGMFSPAISCEAAIKEINERFKEHGIGFQFHAGRILRIDSEFTHQEVAVPALTLLQQPFLGGAYQEFLAAHEHHRHGRYKECLNECLKAFESTMKAICHTRKWPYNQNDTARALIKVCEDNNLFPVFMENHLNGLRMTLESGVPTARNKTSAHGQGVTPIKVSAQFASYVLNLTATNIRFLAESERAMK